MTGRGSYRGNQRGRGTQGSRQGRGGHQPQQPRHSPDSHSHYHEKETPLEQAILRAVESVMSTHHEDLLSSRSPTRSRSESSRRSHHSSRRSPSPPRHSRSSRQRSRSKVCFSTSLPNLQCSTSPIFYRHTTSCGSPTYCRQPTCCRQPTYCRQSTYCQY